MTSLDVVGQIVSDDIKTVIIPKCIRALRFLMNILDGKEF